MRMTGMDGERMFGDVSDKVVDRLEWDKWEEQMRMPLPDSPSTLQVEYDQFGRVVRYRHRRKD